MVADERILCLTTKPISEQAMILSKETSHARLLRCPVYLSPRILLLRLLVSVLNSQ
jgi:hypothetical protein